MSLNGINTELLFTVRLKVTPPDTLGSTPFGERRIVRVTGGKFEGPRMNGIVLPGGGDWLLLRYDGSLQLDVRVTLQTDNKDLIYMTYRGIRHGPEEVMERLNRGEDVDPSEYYFRIAPFFETGSTEYGWLNRIVSVGVGRRLPEGPVYDVYEIL